ncbi:S8 family serine peptidase [Patescibacteria group bacterium]|nr:S8 family serine peptidase [Patescibacteria group bacterium]
MNIKKNHKKNMNNPPIETKSEVKTNTKVLIAAAVVAGLILAAGLLISSTGTKNDDSSKSVTTKQVAKEVSPVTEETGDTEIPTADFTPNEILVKFKTGADKQQIINDFFSQPVGQTYDTQTNEVVYNILKKEADTEEEETYSAERYEVRDVELKVQNQSALFEKPENLSDETKERLASRGLSQGSLLNSFNSIGLGQWEKIKFNNEEVDVISVMRQLEVVDGIEIVEPNYIVEGFLTPNDTYWSTSGAWGQGYRDLWGLPSINVEDAWDITTGSPSVWIAVIDSGVDYNHPDIDDQVIQGYDYVNDDADPMDDLGHGTHVAGTIAAELNNNEGIVGVCPHCKIMPIKCIDENNHGVIDDIVAAINFAVIMQADVINMSLGARASVEALDDAIEYAHAQNIVLIASAGNDNKDNTPNTPASNYNVITVASIDTDDQKTDFSSYGKIDVAAPGGNSYNESDTENTYINILSLRADNTDLYLGSPGYPPGKFFVGPNDNYYRASGTSMAAPHVAGLAGLILSVHPTFTPEQVRGAITQSAVDIMNAGWDMYSGHGKIDCLAALQVDDPLVANISHPGQQLSLIPGETSIEIIGSAGGGDFNHYTLSYSVFGGTNLVTFASSTNEVDNDVLGTWDTTGRKGSYTLYLTVYTNSSGSRFMERHITTGHDWVYDMGYNWYSQELVAADIDASSPGKEVLGIYDQFYSDHNKIIALRTDGTMVPGWPILFDTIGSETISGSPAIGNVDDDNYPEIAYFIGNSIFVSEHNDANGNGEIDLYDYWPNVATGYFIESLILYDLDNDSHSEVIGISRTGSSGYLNIYNKDGNSFSPGVWPKSYDLPVTTPPAVGNLDNDEEGEIVIGAGGYVYAYNPDGSDLNSNWPVHINNTYNYPVNVNLADLDQNGSTEVIASFREKIYVFDSATGNLYPGSWPFVVSYIFPPTFLSVVVGEIDSTVPGLEVVTILQGGTGDMGLYVLKSDATLLNANWPLGYPVISSHFKPPTLADLDGNGEMEILLDDNVYVYAYNKNAESFSSAWPKRFSVSDYGFLVGGHPLVDDLDGNGMQEMVNFSIPNQEIFHMNLSTSGKADWSMYFHDARSTGNYNFPNPVYVDVSNDGYEDGGYDSPFNTISEAVQASQEASTIYVGPGEYLVQPGEEIIMKEGQVLKSSNGSLGTVIRCSTSNDCVNLSNFDSGGVEGFTFIDSTASNGAIQTNNSEVVIKNNVFINCGVGVLVNNGAALIENNSMYNQLFGIAFWGPIDATVRNNILVGNGSGASVGLYRLANFGINGEIGYNNIWNFNQAYADFDLETEADYDISVDPLYVNAGLNNLHLQLDSLSIDAGDPSDDYSQEPAPNGNRINQGAYGNTLEATTSDTGATGCTDSDGGVSYYVSGTCTDSSGSYSDNCIGEAIQEAYCPNGSGGGCAYIDTPITCGNGCSGGACVPSEGGGCNPVFDKRSWSWIPCASS